MMPMIAAGTGLPASLQTAIDTGTYDAQALRTDSGYGYIAPRMTIQPINFGPGMTSIAGWLR